jgi:hypothetical protein
MVTITDVNFLPVTITILTWCTRKQNTSPGHDSHQRSFDRLRVTDEQCSLALYRTCWEPVHCRLVLNSLSWISKLMGSIPTEVIGFFNWPNLSSCTMAMVLTQPLTEMSTRNLPGLGLTTSPPFVSRLSRKCGSLDRLLQGQLYRLMHFKKTSNYDQL